MQPGFRKGQYFGPLVQLEFDRTLRCFAVTYSVLFTSPDIGQFYLPFIPLPFPLHPLHITPLFYSTSLSTTRSIFLTLPLFPKLSPAFHSIKPLPPSLHTHSPAFWRFVLTRPSFQMGNEGLTEITLSLFSTFHFISLWLFLSFTLSFKPIYSRRIQILRCCFIWLTVHVVLYISKFDKNKGFQFW